MFSDSLLIYFHYYFLLLFTPNFLSAQNFSPLKFHRHLKFISKHDWRLAFGVKLSLFYSLLSELLSISRHITALPRTLKIVNVLIQFFLSLHRFFKFPAMDNSVDVGQLEEALERSRGFSTRGTCIHHKMLGSE